jgi:hypothetical protein
MPGGAQAPRRFIGSASRAFKELLEGSAGRRCAALPAVCRRELA